MAKQKGIKPVVENRKARHEYHIRDTYEAGLVLAGTEVKSLRMGKGNLQDAYVQIKNGEAWIVNFHISPYAHEKAAAAPQGNRQAAGRTEGIRVHADSAEDLFQKRPGQSRGGGRHREEALR